jgi:ABC-2 type transport system ATP-binding protein
VWGADRVGVRISPSGEWRLWGRSRGRMPSTRTKSGTTVHGEIPPAATEGGLGPRETAGLVAGSTIARPWDKVITLSHRRSHPLEAAILPQFVTVRGLTFDYDTRRAVEDVSFDIAQGTVTALVGPNGAGKTTLLRCLAGLEQPVAGTIVIDGVDALESPRTAHRKLGFLQDFFGVYDALPVERNLLYAAASQGIAPDRVASAVTRASEAVGLTDRLKQLAGDLSRGLRQRLAIARALIHEPPLLLLDEPAAGLDPEARMDLSGLIRSLSASGMTLIVSSHILSELEQYSTHMLAMRDGRTVGPHPIGAPRAGARRLKVTTAGPAAATRQFLEAQPGVSSLRDESDGMSFDYEGDEGARHRLLRAMMDADIPVTAFTMAGADLERLYMAGKSG